MKGAIFIARMKEFAQASEELKREKRLEKKESESFEGEFIYFLISLFICKYLNDTVGVTNGSGLT